MPGKTCEALLTAGWCYPPGWVSCDAAIEVNNELEVGRSAAAAGWLVNQSDNCRPIQRPVAFVISDQSDPQHKHGFTIIL
jgi:hypothetical protein